ncbi:MAG TPA: zinc-binding dehydrogenase [Thermoleophilaceae bacterium]
MRGWITEPGAPSGIALRDRPEPTPAGNEVLIHVEAYAVNRGELRLIEDRSDGWPPGQDVAGTVVESRAGEGPAPGARVVGVADEGGWSERVTVPVHRVAELPEEVSFVQAASLPVAGLTALRTLRTGGPLLGRRVLVTGATGGVGSFAVQLARAAGATVTALVSGPDRVDEAAGLGAHAVLTSLSDEAGPFDLVVDGIGGAVLSDAVRRLAPGGQVTAYGSAGRARSEIAFFDFAGAAPGGRLEGFFIYRTGEETFGADLRVLAEMVAEGRLEARIGLEADWSETAAAVEALRERRSTGKVVLRRS